MVGFSLRKFKFARLIYFFLFLMLTACNSQPDKETIAESNLNDCVILLHGLARTSRAMHKLEVALEPNYQVVNLTYPSKEHTVEKLSTLTIPTVLKACKTTGKIHFVTHSMGGIIVRQYLSQHWIENIGRVVMLGPPNQGSELTDYFYNNWLYRKINGPAGLQLGTKNNNEQTSVPINLEGVNFNLGVIAGTKSYNPFFSKLLVGKDDGKVSVERTKVSGMNDHLVLPVNHTFMMQDSIVIDQVKHYLQHSKFKRPSV